jgi:hypothetical protein
LIFSLAASITVAPETFRHPRDTVVDDTTVGRRGVFPKLRRVVSRRAFARMYGEPLNSPSHLSGLRMRWGFQNLINRRAPGRLPGARGTTGASRLQFKRFARSDGGRMIIPTGRFLCVSMSVMRVGTDSLEPQRHFSV